VIFSSYAQIFGDGGEQRFINVVVNELRDRRLRTDRLPEEIYVNGHLISQAIHRNTTLPINAAVVHASWTSDIKPKIEHMKRFAIWYI
jgi:hypothetical protein